ncbi:glycosyltransferase [Clostridium tarantellae]|uniref:Glycosyltransferase n=1 Tax=Clostridium tarantellae TaxID=39493 RepID=A0A6I1MLC3_9CLOT|nr:glycosyltransferase [Clostridium tarantellae]MPQ44205.1 glycosyltransferase [Clostridium tarantellae]
MKFSVLMSVYKNEKEKFLKTALDSVILQTIKPKEIVIVQDGPLPEELINVIANFKGKYNELVKVIELQENVGLGQALNIGLLECSNEIVARMDTDDICVKNRFELQLNEFKKNKNLDIVGSSIYEFYDSMENVKTIKSVPVEDKEIKMYAQTRNPMNHMTVMFKKSSVVNAGSYQHMLFSEDYFLWTRMMVNGCIFKNINIPLVYARTGADMYKRRGGFIYVKTEYKLQKSLNQIGFINKYKSIKNFTLRSVPRLLPNTIREKIYLNFLRK